MEIPALSEGIMPLATLALSFIIILAMIVAVFLFVKDTHAKMLIILLIMLGAISREMMGFSATIYASSSRTFTILSFFMAISALILADTFENKTQKILALSPALLMLLF